MRRSGAIAVVLTAILGLAAVLPVDAAKVHHVPLQLLAVNDFQGALLPSSADGRPIGGAATLATYLEQARHDFAAATRGSTLTLGGGDLFGASPPVSGLLHDVSTVQALGLMGLEYSVVGNHELDDGLPELMRLQNGGCHRDGTCTGRAAFQYLSANMVYRDTGKTVFPPYAIEKVGGVKVGIIGVSASFTPAIVTPAGLVGIEFLDEVTAANTYAAELQRQGVRTIVVLLHSGGDTDETGSSAPSADVVRQVEAMDDSIDVVVSGHTRNGFATTIDGKLVTQAYSNGVAFADIELVLDRDSGDVVSKQARIVSTWGDVSPGSTPAPSVKTLVDQATNAVAPLIERVVGTAGADITRAASPSGETALGDLIADAQRARGGTQLAFLNPGSMRADLAAGEVTWGELFEIQPFGNDVVRQQLTGAQIEALLEQQWLVVPNRVLQTSGIRYTWSAAGAPGDRVDPADVYIDGVRLDLHASYSVTSNSYLAVGGDGFSVLAEGTDHEVVGGSDAEAFVAYVEGLPAGFTVELDGRTQVR